MYAEIHAVDTCKIASEGKNLSVRSARIDITLKPYNGLPLGEHKDQHYLEVQASSLEDTTRSTLVAQLDAEDLQRLFDAAYAAGMVTVPIDRRVVDLVEQLRKLLGADKSVRR
jgi:hypothetical protein